LCPLCLGYSFCLDPSHFMGTLLKCLYSGIFSPSRSLSVPIYCFIILYQIHNYLPSCYIFIFLFFIISHWEREFPVIFLSDTRYIVDAQQIFKSVKEFYIWDMHCALFSSVFPKLRNMIYSNNDSKS
jgi:hypothetical protein